MDSQTTARGTTARPPTRSLAGLAARLRGPRRGVRRSLVVAALAMSLLGINAVPASAATWQFNDSFEPNPTPWVTQTLLNGSAGVYTLSHYARTGSRLAILKAGGNSQASVRRTIRITPAGSHQATCRAAAYVRPYGTSAVIWLEVFDTSWRDLGGYAARTLQPSSTYQQVLSSKTWISNPLNARDVIVRVTLSRSQATGLSDVDVDDVTIVCTY